MPQSFLLVALGGAVGSAARYAVSVIIPAPPSGFPWATLCVNIAGAFLIGMLAGIAGQNRWVENTGWPLLVTGLCGGFTTFSAFALENVRLLERGHIAAVLLYATVSVLAGLAVCWLGLRLAR